MREKTKKSIAKKKTRAKNKARSASPSAFRRRPTFLPADFESASDSHAEDALRARLLFRHLLQKGDRHATASLFSRVDALSLAIALKRTSEDGAPKSLASSVYMREVRSSVLCSTGSEIVYYKNNQLVIFTTINDNWRFTPGQLQTISAIQIKRQFTTHLHRAGVLKLPGFIIGFLHGEFEPTSGMFVLHYHLLTTENRAQAISSMRNKWGYFRTPTGAPAILCQRLKNRERQLSYLLKAYWPERAVVMLNGKPRRVRAHQRIKGPPHSAWLMWMHRQTLAGLAIVSNVTLRKERIKIKRER